MKEIMKIFKIRIPYLKVNKRRKRKQLSKNPTKTIFFRLYLQSELQSIKNPNSLNILRKILLILR